MNILHYRGLRYCKSDKHFEKKAYYTSIVENLQKITLNILINHSGLTVLHVSKLFLKIQILDEHSEVNP